MPCESPLCDVVAFGSDDFRGNSAGQLSGEEGDAFDAGVAAHDSKWGEAAGGSIGGGEVLLVYADKAVVRNEISEPFDVFDFGFE